MKPKEKLKLICPKCVNTTIELMENTRDRTAEEIFTKIEKITLKELIDVDSITKKECMRFAWLMVYFKDRIKKLKEE